MTHEPRVIPPPSGEPPNGAIDCDCLMCLCERIDEQFRSSIALFDHAELSVQEFRELYDEVLALMTRVCADDASLHPKVPAEFDAPVPADATCGTEDVDMDIPF